jgi:dihydropteroate synthase
MVNPLSHNRQSRIENRKSDVHAPRVLSAPDSSLPHASELPWVIHDGVRVRTGTAAQLRKSFPTLLRDYRRRDITVPFPGGALKFGARTLIMGILNVTPDSFSDGGRHFDPDLAIQAGLAMEDADVLDVGGESTRPGSDPVTSAEETRRIEPVVRALARRKRLVSIDTTKPAVARAAFAAGARILNDVSALADPDLGREAARARVPVILMHMKGTPRTMQRHAVYRDVVAEIADFFRARLDRALSLGIPRARILLDPGIGFGKRPEHNLEILRRLEEFRSLGRPVVVGTSRKSFIGHVLGRPVEARRDGTSATVAAAVLRGADMVRVHDVREMADAARMADRMK